MIYERRSPEDRSCRNCPYHVLDHVIMRPGEAPRCPVTVTFENAQAQVRRLVSLGHDEARLRIVPADELTNDTLTPKGKANVHARGWRVIGVDLEEEKRWKIKP